VEQSVASLPDLIVEAADIPDPALASEGERLPLHYGAEVRLFNPHGLPMAGSVGPDHPKVQQLRAWPAWSGGQAWIRPERHGSPSAVFKIQVDWLPLGEGSLREGGSVPTQEMRA